MAPAPASPRPPSQQQSCAVLILKPTSGSAPSCPSPSLSATCPAVVSCHSPACPHFHYLSPTFLTPPYPLWFATPAAVAGGGGDGETHRLKTSNGEKMRSGSRVRDSRRKNPCGALLTHLQDKINDINRSRLLCPVPTKTLGAQLKTETQTNTRESGSQQHCPQQPKGRNSPNVQPQRNRGTECGSACPKPPGFQMHYFLWTPVWEQNNTALSSTAPTGLPGPSV